MSFNTDYSTDVPAALIVGLDWNPITTAPKDGTIIRLRDEKRMHSCEMEWDKKRKLWTGRAYGLMGATKTYWDEEFCQIFEWQHLGA